MCLLQYVCVRSLQKQLAMLPQHQEAVQLCCRAVSLMMLSDHSDCIFLLMSYHSKVCCCCKQGPASLQGAQMSLGHHKVMAKQ